MFFAIVVLVGASWAHAASAPGPDDPASQRLYWTELGSGTVRCALLDGTGVQTLHVGLPSPQGIGVDPIEGKLYWADPIMQRIERSNLDGSAREVVVEIDGFPVGLDVDPVGRSVYWCDPLSGALGRYDLDLGQTAVLASGLASPQDVRVERGVGGDVGEDGAQLYWLIPTEGIYRGGVGASDVELLTPGFVGQALSFAFVPDRGRVFWVSFQRLRSVGVFGGCEDASGELVGASDGIVFDEASGRLYWIDPDGQRLVCAGPEGESVVEVLGGLALPRRLAIGPAGAAPTIRSQSEAMVVDAGQSVTLGVDAAGTGPLSYVWRQDGVELSGKPGVTGATTPTLTLEGVGRERVGVYECEVGGPFGSVVSAAIVVAVRAELADSNFSGVVNDQDFFDFVNAFFLGGGADPG